MSPRHLAFGADLLTGLVIVSLAVAAAGLTWRLAGSDGVAATVAPPPAVARASTAPAAGSAADLVPILAFAAFGRPSAGDAPATGLDLVLRGILRAQPASASAAMIAIGTTPPRAFLTGQSVSGATIEGIEAERVLLRVGGRLESLAFPHLAVATPPSASATPASTAAAAAPPPAPLAAVPPASLAAALGAAATDQGYRIGVSPPPALARAGLVPGDVIERINDVPVGDPEKERAMIASAAAGPVRVTLLRGGRRVTLSASLP